MRRWWTFCRRSSQVGPLCACMPACSAHALFASLRAACSDSVVSAGPCRRRRDPDALAVRTELVARVLAGKCTCLFAGCFHALRHHEARSAKPNFSAVWQPFSLSLWACIIATVFLMALVFWLYSHLSVRGAYPVRSARQGKRYCPGLPVVLDMAARMPPHPSCCPAAPLVQVFGHFHETVLIKAHSTRDCMMQCNLCTHVPNACQERTQMRCARVQRRRRRASCMSRGAQSWARRGALATMVRICAWN